MIFRVSNLRVWPVAAVLLAGQMGLMGQATQQGTPPAADAQPPQSAQQPQTGQQQSDAAVLAQQAQATAAPAKTQPDYPDPRTLITFGAFYWITANGSGPNLVGGSQSVPYPGEPNFDNLSGIGKPKQSEDIQLDIAITRTGILRVEYFRTQGDGNQTLTKDSDLFLNQFYKGNYLATTYKMQSGKIYLDDLLWPYKFPVSRFRLKSLWEFQYFTVVSSVDAPLAPQTTASGNAISTTGQGTRVIYLPTLGLAAEYALTPHILLRADASGFGLPHKSALWDGSATIAWRHNLFEVVGGYKVFHFKSSPNNTEYVTGMVDGPFVGLRFHLF